MRNRTLPVGDNVSKMMNMCAKVFVGFSIEKISYLFVKELIFVIKHLNVIENVYCNEIFATI